MIIRTGLMILLLTFVGLTSATAADKPADVIKYREAVMEAMSSHVSAILLIATNKIDGQQFLQVHADSLDELSSQLDMLFPADTIGGDTEALDSITAEPEKFAAAIKQMQDASAALRKAAGGDSNVMGAFAQVGKGCKGCHESFRAED